MGIHACQKLMPGKPNVAVFDTSFGMTLPAKAYRYAIPTEYFEKYHIRRYGFHGTSHSFVSKETIKYHVFRIGCLVMYIEQHIQIGITSPIHKPMSPTEKAN